MVTNGLSSAPAWLSVAPADAEVAREPKHAKSVLIVSTETVGDTIRPRLIAAGADDSKVFVFRKPVPSSDESDTGNPLDPSFQLGWDLPCIQ